MAEQLLNGRYRLLRSLGTGGMAGVYLAEDLRLRRRVAVKILHPQFATDPAFVARFEQEARMVAALSHPNIVQVYDVGHDGDRYYIVMEYVEGETVKELIARQGALSVPQALSIISATLSALEFAHAHNLIHRDIKAQNILLTPDGDVKVTDFGIARDLGGATTPTLTATGMVIGTVQYFSPEQAQGRPATPQSDIYAAGVVLYEMLTGTLPFDADNPLAVAMQQINQSPPLPTRVNPAIPPSVEAIVLKALAKNPANRYAGAGEMKAAVDAARAGAAEVTRLATRPTAVPPPEQQTTLPGVIRTATGPAPQINIQSAREAPVGLNTQRALWITALVLAAVLAAILGIRYGGGIFGGGGTATPTATPSVTPQPTGTGTPAPTATRHAVVVPSATSIKPAPSATPTRLAPTATTPTPTATTTKPTPTATSTGVAPSATPTDTATGVPPSATPTATTAPPTGTPTATPADTDTPTPAPLASTATSTPPSAGVPSIHLAPGSAAPGDVITVTGSGWPSGATVTLSADFTNGTTILARPIAANDGFTATFTVPAGTTAGYYMIQAQDDSGHSASRALTVTS